MTFGPELPAAVDPASTSRGASPALATRPSHLRGLLGSRLFGQSAIFTVGSIVVMLCGAAGKAILGNALVPARFGEFALCTSVLGFLSMFFDFGLFTPAARLIARSPGRKAEVVGTAFLAFIPVGLLFSLTVFGLSYVVQPVFGADIGVPLRIVSPLACVYAFGIPFSQIAQGADRVGSYAIAAVCGQIVFLIALIAAGAAHVLSVDVALVINTVGLLVTALAALAYLRPALTGVQRHLRLLIKETRSWGFQVFIGRVLSMGTYNMDVLMVAAFATSREVGFYVLAGALAQAGGLPITGLGTASFHALTHQRTIRRGWLVTAWSFGAVGVVAIAMLGPIAIGLALPAQYAPVVGLAIPLAMAQALRGVTGLYNTYLASHALGRELRRCGLILTVSNVLLNFALIPPFGAVGAAWASLGALVPNYLAHLHYYRGQLSDPGVVDDLPS
jgi:O-antigen/teichoic acid export membrane protein